MLMHHGHVSIPVCTISILWNFHTNPYHTSKNYELKQQGDGAGETSRTTNYELQGRGWATRVSVANEASRWNIAAKCSGVLHVHVVMVKLLFAVTILGSIPSFHKNRMSAFPLSWLLM